MLLQPLVSTRSFDVYIFTTIIISVFTLSDATATVSVDTMEFGQPNKNHHFNIFAPSVATATVVSIRLYFVYISKTINF